MKKLVQLRPKRETRVLDMGSWLGNFSLAAKYLGYQVAACDDWRQPGLEAQKALFAANEIDCIDRCVIENHVEPFDVVLLMSVIEHIPHTPRFLLKTVNRLLKPGGLLILDTPNLAYIYNRRRLNRGESIHPPIQEQFISEIPFEGHNREYTFDELVWMLNASGFFVGSFSFFNYSMYGVKHPYLMNARSLAPMLLNPAQRELIFLSARKFEEL